MKYSLVNGIRAEAQPGLSGVCPVCKSLTAAKCGKVRIWHWSHRGKKECDPWWENETKWHRAWKNHFPQECQEVIHYAENGVMHRADVKTNQGYVIEFQHSPIKPEERNDRNEFYKKIVWVVNGKRRIRDEPQFLKALHENPKPITNQIRKIRIMHSNSTLLTEWANIPVPVFFDFGEENLWCLLSSSDGIWGYIVELHRLTFIMLHSNGADQMLNFKSWLSLVNSIINPVFPKKVNQEPAVNVPQAPSRQLFMPRMHRGARIDRFTRYKR